MRDGRIVRSLALIATASLVLGAFVAGPADAKKKKKKKPKVAACAPYVPGENGADAPITVVTDAATEEAPVEVTVSTAEGLGLSSADGPSGDEGHTSHAYANVQVDSAASGAGLYARVEFAPTWDYDAFLRTADGTAVAYSAGFNQGAVAPDPTGFGLDGTGHGGHSEQGAEQIDGWTTADCDGFTYDIVSAATPGGDVTVKFWLGEPGS